MFEIGNSLREARLRQGLDLARVEDDTKIRAKYLQALEDERFEVLPSETYVKGFLRTYAEYLGLDGQLYVDEFNSRFASAEEPIVSAPPRKRKRRPGDSSYVVAALAGIVAVAVLVFAAFMFPEDEPKPGPTAGLGTTPAESAGACTKVASASPVRLELVAERGDTFVVVRRGSPAGETLYSGTIFRGERQVFEAKRLFLELGDQPVSNLNVCLNGARAGDVPDGGLLVVTAQGIRAQG
jgi:cytoskeleton protein RodZ